MIARDTVGYARTGAGDEVGSFPVPITGSAGPVRTARPSKRIGSTTGCAAKAAGRGWTLARTAERSGSSPNAVGDVRHVESLLWRAARASEQRLGGASTARRPARRS